MKKLTAKQLTIIHIVALLLLAVALFSTTFAVENNRCKQEITNHMRTLNEYIKEQCIKYDAVNAGTSMKSLFALSDKAMTLQNLIDTEKTNEVSALESLVNTNRLTGVITVNFDTLSIHEYTLDGLDYIAWQYAFSKYSSVSDDLHKSYCERYYTSDGGCYDYAIVGRSDCKGLILCYVKYSTNEITSSQMSIKNLLSGYKFEKNGVIVITDGVNVIASNAEEYNGMLAADCPVVADMRLQSGFDELLKTDDNAFFGMRAKTNNYYIYTYVPVRDVFSNRNLALAYVAVIYVVFVMVLFFVKQRVDRVKRTEKELNDQKYKQELTDLTAQAVHANDVKTEFLRRMSHDIRTPINGIRGMVKIGDYYADDLEKQKECREKVWESSGYLLDLVNDALDITKFDAKEFELKEEPFSMGQLIEEVCNMNEYRAKENGLNFDLEKPYIEHDALIGAGVQLKRVLTNLLGNAVKYNVQGGSVTLSCRERTFDDETANFEFVCADTGVGMSEEFQKVMFEPFARENDDSMKSGVGLGLSIVKKTVDKMNGTISVNSAKGKGTTFTIDIPFRIAKENALTEKGNDTDEEENTKVLDGVNVLVAEDNDINFEIVQFILQTAGAKVLWAKDGLEAVKTFTASEPGSINCVLMDVMMPVVDGMEATRRIRTSNRPDSDVVIIAMTANAFDDDVKRVLDSGMNDNLSKPLDSQKLVDTVAKYLKKE